MPKADPRHAWAISKSRLEQAREWHRFMVSQVVLMLCAGTIHGDLSEFNVLVDATGPVIIDLPQAVDAASNNNAFALFERDVNNLRDTFGRSAPALLTPTTPTRSGRTTARER